MPICWNNMLRIPTIVMLLVGVAMTKPIERSDTVVDQHEHYFLVWNCADEHLKNMTQKAMQQYHDVDDINLCMQQMLDGYRNGGWAVITINYTRTTGNMIPDSLASNDINICYIAMPDLQIVTVIAKVVSANAILPIHT